MPTVADLYRYRGGENQRSNFRRIAAAIARSGPVLLDGAILSGRSEGELWDLDISLVRAFDEFARGEKDGFVHHDKSKIPPDEDLSRLWGFPLAKDVEVVD